MSDGRIPGSCAGPRSRPDRSCAWRMAHFLVAVRLADPAGSGPAAKPHDPEPDPAPQPQLQTSDGQN